MAQPNARAAGTLQCERDVSHMRVAGNTHSTTAADYYCSIVVSAGNVNCSGDYFLVNTYLYATSTSIPPPRSTVRIECRTKLVGTYISFLYSTTKIAVGSAIFAEDKILILGVKRRPGQGRGGDIYSKTRPIAPPTSMHGQRCSVRPSRLEI